MADEFLASFFKLLLTVSPHLEQNVGEVLEDIEHRASERIRKIKDMPFKKWAGIVGEFLEEGTLSNRHQHAVSMDNSDLLCYNCTHSS